MMISKWLVAVSTALLCGAAGVAAAEGEMKLGYTLIYVEDVARSVAFYEQAFGLERGFVHESGSYAEMATGETKLGFVAHEQAKQIVPGGYRAGKADELPAGMEIALVTADVPAAYERAVAAGAASVAEPIDKPWGQTVAYVRDPDGTLVELASPMGPPAPTTPHHILTILAVLDLDKAVAFYRAAFGWVPRVEVPVYVEFELPDGRGLGLYIRDGFAHNTGQAPAPIEEGAITGTEIYLHCADPAAVAEQLKAAGARELSALAPRDWGDEAAYYADPDGNVLVVARPLPATAEAP